MSGDGFSCSTSSPPIITENKSFQPMKKCETDDVKLAFKETGYDDPNSNC